MTTPLLSSLFAEPWAIYRPALQGLLKQVQQVSPAAIETHDGRFLRGARNAYLRGNVAVIPVIGPIAHHFDWLAYMLDMPTTEGIAKDLSLAASLPDVDGILLHFDTPGGQTGGLQHLAQHIRQIQSIKPVDAYISSLGCSAGYWLASACQKIYAAETAIIGSVGVLMATEAQDASEIIITSANAPRKALDPGSDAGRHELLEIANAIEKVFIADVARYRGVSQDKVISDFGQGGVLVGDAALAAGMVDGLSNFETVLRKLARRGANSQGDDAMAQAEQDLETHARDAELQQLQARVQALETDKQQLQTKLDAVQTSEAEAVETLKAEQHRWKDLQALFDVLEGDAYAALHVSCLHGGDSRDQAVAKIKALRAELGQASTVSATWEQPDTPAKPKAREDFESLVAAQVDKGLSRREAIKAVAKSHPQAHAQYIAQANAA